MNDMKKIFSILLLFVVLTAFCMAENDIAENSVSEDEILLVDVPVYIGEDNFIEKIHARAASAGRDQPLGLVLSGGAARAMAHLGVLQKMEEEGIIPDFIVTDSMGSIVGLLYSAGMSTHQIYDIMHTFPLGTLFQPKLPTQGGVLDTSQFIAVLNGLLGDVNIENLKIPVAVVTEDLISRRMIIFEEGDMYKLLLGSIAIPVDFAPQDYRGYRLMDGGCTNLLPVNVAYRYTDRVVASSTLYTFKQNLKNFVTIVNRMQDVSKTRAAVHELKQHDDLVWLRNPVEKYSFMGFDKIDEIIDLGYQCASENIDALKAVAESSVSPETIKEEFLAGREEFQKKFDDYCREYKKREVISLDEFNTMLTVGLSLLGELPNDYFLNDYNYVYLGECFGYKTVRFNLREYWFPDNYGLDSTFSFALSDMFRTKSRGLIDFEDNKLHSGYYYTNNEIVYFSYDNFGVVPFLTIEGKLSDEFKDEYSFNRVGLNGYVGDNKFLRYSLFGFRENQHVDGIGATAYIQQHLFWLVNLDEKVTYRMPIYQSKTVRLYKNDGVRGDTKTGYFDRVLMAASTFYIQPDFRPSLAEAFIINDFGIGPFADFYYFDDCFFTAGMAMKFNVMFIGIRPIKFLCYGGWDFKEREFFAKFSIGTEF